MYLVLIVLFVTTCSIMFLYFDNKLYAQRKQILFLSNQTNTMRNKVIKNIIIKYSDVNFKYGFTKGNCTINLAPIDEQLIVCTLGKNTNINIVNRAEVNGTIWYEVLVSSKERLNNQGWIKATEILFPETLNQISTL